MLILTVSLLLLFDEYPNPQTFKMNHLTGSTPVIRISHYVNPIENIDSHVREALNTKVGKIRPTFVVAENSYSGPYIHVHISGAGDVFFSLVVVFTGLAHLAAAGRVMISSQAAQINLKSWLVPNHICV